MALLVLGTMSGCAGFRAQFGGGIGLGADFKIPGFCHTGLSAGEYMNIGIRYDDPELSHDAEVTAVAWHWEGRQSRRRGEGRKFICEHACFGWIPPYTTYVDKDELAIWDFEIGVNLLVLDMRLGFNPARLVHPAKVTPRDNGPEPGARETGTPEVESRSGGPAPAPSPKKPRRDGNYYETDPLLQPGDPPPDGR
jgi:hypothetical protein